jgi:hypothetical protein
MPQARIQTGIHIGIRSDGQEPIKETAMTTENFNQCQDIVLQMTTPNEQPKAVIIKNSNGNY